MRQYEPMGLEGTLRALIDYDSIDEGFPVSPWELCFDEGSQEIYLDPFRPLLWWSLRLLLTRRPLQEKLAVFWHDHFAINAEKIQLGPAMLAYLETLRANASGPFAELLVSVSQEPAMIRWLDTDTSFAGHPNENFAREALELFTMGSGYSENDVKQLARCFTGWGIRYLIFEEGGEMVQAKARECIAEGRPMLAFCQSPALYDRSPRTLFGERGQWDGESALRRLAERPETSRHLARKLWEFFAYPNPGANVVERLASAFRESGGSVRAVIWSIARSPEFWSEECVRGLVKGPVDFVVPIVRQLGVRGALLALRGDPQPTTPLAKPLRDTAGLLVGAMQKQGMLLFYPPNVGGWEWGSAWITEQNMIERFGFSQLIMPLGEKAPPVAGLISGLLSGTPMPGFARLWPSPPADDRALIERMRLVFDAPIDGEQREVLEQASARHGGPQSLGRVETAAPLLRETMRLMFGAPEFQFH